MKVEQERATIEFVRTHDTDDRCPATGYDNACAPEYDRVRSPGGERDSWVNAHLVGPAHAVNAQNHMNTLQQAATTQGVIQIYSVDTMADADAATGLAESLIQILPTNQSGGGGR